MEDRVFIDGDIHRLRDDNTIHLGINVWFRPSGLKEWTGTTFDGRATLTPGMSYDTMICLEGTQPPLIAQPPGILYYLKSFLLSLIS